MTTVVADARAGRGSWKGKQTDKPLFVANYYPNVWQLVVPPPPTSGSSRTSRARRWRCRRAATRASPRAGSCLLKVNGMKLEDLGTKSFGSITENAEAIRNRQAVAMGWYTTVPASFMLDLGTSTKLRLIGVPDDAIEKMRQINPGFVRHVIPKATYAQYGVDEDVVTIQAPTILIANAKTPADVVYKITKAIVEGREDFGRVTAAMKGVTGKDMAQNHGLPDAPGRREVLPRSRPVK